MLSHASKKKPNKNQNLILHFSSYRGSGPLAIEKQLLARGKNSVQVFNFYPRRM